jgi:hypothetical protein
VIYIPISNSELSPEYLRAFYDLVLQHPDIMKHITDEIHITARAKAGGQLHAKVIEVDDEERETKVLKVNASRFGGNVIEANDDITVIPAVLMAEGVRNGGLHRYEDFSQNYQSFNDLPIVPPHDPMNPAASMVTPETNRLGQLRNVKLNTGKRRVEAEAVLFNHKFDPNDIARIKSGEAFGGSIGFWADDELLPEPQKWTDGNEYNRIEKNFSGNHFSIVANPACPLGTCGFNVNAKEPDIMVEPVITPPAGNPALAVEPPAVAIPHVNALTEEKLTGIFSAFEIKINSRFDAIDKTIADKDAEINALKAAEEVRVNAQKGAEDALVLTTLDSMLLPAFKDKKAEYFPAFKGNAALFIAQNPDKIDLAAFTKPAVIAPSGAAFVPHVNASDEEAELAGLGVMSTEDLAKSVTGGR